MQGGGPATAFVTSDYTGRKSQNSGNLISLLFTAPSHHHFIKLRSNGSCSRLMLMD